MKKLLTALILSCTAITASAEYFIQIPLEHAQGGHLPNGSIQLGSTAPTPIENWVAIDPVYSEWQNGEIFECGGDTWAPDPSTEEIGEIFTQTNPYCWFETLRTRQDREQETTTGEIRVAGAAIIEKEQKRQDSTKTTGTRDAHGTDPRCYYGGGEIYWLVKNNSDEDTILWNWWNPTIYLNGHNLSSATVDGYRYTRDELIFTVAENTYNPTGSEIGDKYYKVCKSFP